MGITAGTVITHVNMLRSKIAVIDMMVTYLLTNYTTLEDDKQGSEPIPPEMFIDRPDFARVPEEHIHNTIEDLNKVRDGYQAELDAYESMEIDVKKETYGTKASNHNRSAARDHAGRRLRPRDERRTG